MKNHQFKGNAKFPEERKTIISAKYFVILHTFSRSRVHFADRYVLPTKI
jgi:hypothetical protein